MTKLKAHFDGKVLVPDEPVDLPVDRDLEIQINFVSGYVVWMLFYAGLLIKRYLMISRVLERDRLSKMFPV